MKKYIPIIGCILLLSCQQNKQAEQTEISSEPVQNSVSEPQENKSDENATVAQKWLSESIEKYFSQEDPDMQRITTPEYFEYKTDATNVDFDIDGSLTEKQFHEKWKNKFDTQKAGIGVGFLISGQDWSKIEVEKCELVSSENNQNIFDVILIDREMKEQYKIKVKVVPSNNSFLISDVEQ